MGIGHAPMALAACADPNTGDAGVGIGKNTGVSLEPLPGEGLPLLCRSLIKPYGLDSGNP